ncbi:MAG: hypothetical protein V3W37_02965 [Candidatus Binatia bacterium]
MDKLQREMIEKYTRIKKFEDPRAADNAPDTFTVWLTVEGQHFCWSHEPYDDKEEAVVMQQSLGAALTKIVRDNKHGE